MRLVAKAIAHAAAAAAMIGLGSAAPAAAALSTNTPEAPRSGPVETLSLKQLPTNHEDLVFHGETASHAWAVYFNKSEVAQVSRLQLALLNTISVLPDRSSLAVSINGRDLGEVPAASAQTPSIMSIAIPPGLLVPGFNAVTMRSHLVHRVDCSIIATHELWASLKPAQTGFVLAPAAHPVAPSIEDLASERLAEDGTTHLHLRLADPANAADLDRAARFIAALVRRMHFVRPVVDVGPSVGSGPGFDLVLGRSKQLRSAQISLPADLTLVDNVAIGRDPGRGRTVLALTAADDAGLDAALAGFVGTSLQSGLVATPAAAKLMDEAIGPRIEAGQSLSFADLGLGDVNVTGRRFVGAFRLRLPDNFYGGGSARAHLFLNGTHAGDLQTEASMTIRVNGKIASFSNIGTGLPQSFRNYRIDLPYGDFQPGENLVEIETLTPSQLDDACDTAQMPDNLRLSLQGSSRLEFASIAHLRVTPELAGTLRLGAEGLDIYLPDAGAASLASGLTVAANAAAEWPQPAGPVDAPVKAGVSFHLAPPKPTDRPGLVITPFDSLPDDLAMALSRVANLAAVLPFDMDDASLALRLDTDPSPSPSPSAPAPLGAVRPDPAKAWIGLLTKASGEAKDELKAWHFYLGGIDDNPSPLSVSNETLLVAALEPDRAIQALAGVVLPRFNTSSRQWIVVAAANAAITRAGIEHLVAGGLWPRLAGQAVSFGVDSEQLHTRVATERTYVLPQTLRLQDIRPMLGGFMSDNIIVSAASLMILIVVLGLSTHVLIKQLGVRER